jgi:hypothetical protein
MDQKVKMIEIQILWLVFVKVIKDSNNASNLIGISFACENQIFQIFETMIDASNATLELKIHSS